MARATATRCCSPPESCEGKWSSRCSRPTSASACRVEWFVGNLVHQRNVFENRQARNEIVELKYETDVLTPVTRKLASSAPEIGRAIAPFRMSARRARQNVEQRRLAGAGWPKQHNELAFVDLEVDVS